MLVGCGSPQLPPPAQPDLVLPRPTTDVGPPAAGETTVLIDADHPARVEEVAGRIEGARPGVEIRPVCLETPCAVNLRQGPHTLVFSSTTGALGGSGELSVGADPIAYRYALGARDIDHDARVGGGVTALVGVAAMAIGGGIFKGGEQSNEAGEIHAGGAIALTGVALALIGLAVAVGNDTHQNGTGVQWRVAPTVGAR